VFNLPTTSSLLQITTGAASTIAVHASWLDLTIAGTDVLPNALNTTIAAPGTTTVVPSPGSGVNRNVKFLSVVNTAGPTCPVTIQHVGPGASPVSIFAIDLPLGWIIQYNTDGNGFLVYDENGNIQETEN
jgi:hypothetical protein